MKKIISLCITACLLTLAYSQTPCDFNPQVTADISDFYANASCYGVVLTSPNGTCYRIRVEDDGTLITEPITCPSTPGGSANLEFIDVIGGTFDMGCTPEQSSCNSDESPVHSVTLSSFKLSKYEITNAQYAEFMNAVGAIGGSLGGVLYISTNTSEIDYIGGVSVPEVGRENYPVSSVYWAGAEAYCTWAGGRLPTEAEWEYAARGGNQSQGYIYSGSNNINDVAWYSSNSGSDTHLVGTKNPNELGLYDMSGNVQEFCNDFYDSGYYSISPSNNPQGPASGSSRVTRGGSRYVGSSNQRVSYRDDRCNPCSASSLGFRCAKDF